MPEEMPHMKPAARQQIVSIVPGIKASAIEETVTNL
jgi:hypothetical protein